MSGSKHKKIGLINEFCPEPGKPCQCPKKNNYRTICTPSWAGTDDFAIGKTGKVGTWEAHHVLSISCVNWKPDESQKQEALMRVLSVTVWCINKKKNMKAMPKFGHTVMYYTDVISDKYFVVDFKAPAFEKIPQHDFEHIGIDSYCSEVKEDIAALWDRVAEETGKHEDVAKGLEGELDDLITKWQNELTRRGKRRDGTHASWKRGMKNPNSDWYLPFSMADDDAALVRQMPWTDKVNDKMVQIQESLRAVGKL